MTNIDFNLQVFVFTFLLPRYQTKTIYGFLSIDQLLNKKGKIVL